jgi:hypothetical protein
METRVFQVIEMMVAKDDGPEALCFSPKLSATEPIFSAEGTNIFFRISDPIRIAAGDSLNPNPPVIKYFSILLRSDVADLRSAKSNE